VISSVIAAWSDVSSSVAGSLPGTSTGVSLSALQTLAGTVRGLNVGYFWMLVNCLTSAAYVSASIPTPRTPSIVCFSPCNCTQRARQNGAEMEIKETYILT
jgi:hypothetical protein